MARKETTRYIRVEDIDAEMTVEHRSKLEKAVRELELHRAYIDRHKDELEDARGVILQIMEAYSIPTVAGDLYGISYVPPTTRYTLNKDLLKANGVSEETINSSLKPSEVGATIKVVEL